MVEYVSADTLRGLSENDPIGDMGKKAALEIERLSRLATDRLYMMEAYRSMLGENGLKVAAMWKEKRVHRVHHSWGPDAHSLTGEQRAAEILAWEEAALNAVPVENIDGPYGKDTPSHG